MTDACLLHPVLPSGTFLLIKDSLYANGSFLLNYFLKKLVFRNSSSKKLEPLESRVNEGEDYDAVCFIALNHAFSHYSSIARKQGFNLTQACNSGKLIFMDLLSEPYFEFSSKSSFDQDGAIDKSSGEVNAIPINVNQSPKIDPAIDPRGSSWQSTPSNQSTVVHKFTRKLGSGNSSYGAEALGSGPLRQLFFRLKHLLTDHFSSDVNSVGPEKNVCIVVDDAMLLESLSGFSTVHTVDFLRYCKTLSFGSQKCSVIVLAHSDAEDESENESEFKVPLVKNLEHFSDAIISVEPLVNGGTENIHGKINIIQKSISRKKSILPEKQNKYVGTRMLHYKVMENNVAFFLPGLLP